MRVIKIQRTISKRVKPNNRSSVRQYARDFIAKESRWEFAIEALAFGTLLAVSAWPIIAAAGAIGNFL